MPFNPVMPGLVPGISINWALLRSHYRDGRDKPGHEVDARCNQ
jgi:hypothetical protein